MRLATLARAGSVVAGRTLLYAKRLTAGPDLGRDRRGGRRAAAGRRAARRRRRGGDSGDHDQCADPRGGAYTDDWIENLLRLNMHSADTVLPKYQHPRVGEGFGYGANAMTFRIVEPEHVLATQSADGNWVWTFVVTCAAAARG